jgi:nucleoside transporter
MEEIQARRRIIHGSATPPYPNREEYDPMTDSVKKPEAAIGARLSVMMFLEFFVWGGWYVTVGNFLKAQGMDAAIPWAYSVCPIAAIISPFFLGIIADRFFSTQKVLGVMCLLSGITLTMLPSVAPMRETYNLWILGDRTVFDIVLLLHAICFMPTLGLTNTVAFSHVTDQKKQFPLIRVFGTIGWIVANLVVSSLLQGDTKAVQFYVAAGAAVLLGVYSFMLPHTPPPAAGKTSSVGDILGVQSLKLMRNGSFAVFVVSSFLICIPLAFYYSYAPVFVGGTGVKEVASLMSLGQMSEIFFMLVMPLCFARLGVKWMLLVGMAAWVVRYGLFAFAASHAPLADGAVLHAIAQYGVWGAIVGDGVHPLVLMGILLHGICYDFFFVTGQIYVDGIAPPRIRGQVQGFLVLVTQGVGMLIGAQVAGKLVAFYTVAERIQWLNVWGIPCIAAGVIMLVFAATFRSGNEQKPAEELAA